MMIAMPLAVVAYVALVAYCARKAAESLELKQQDKILEESARSQHLVNQKESFYLEKIRLENEVLEILTLYEIMKEITQSLSEREAFEIFKSKLRDHVSFTDCLLVHPLSDEINEYKKMMDYIRK